MICQKSALRVFSFVAVAFVFSSTAFAQVFQRPRIVPQPPATADPQTTSRQVPANPMVQRPTLTNKLVVSTPTNTQNLQVPLVKKTASVTPVNAAANANLYSNANLMSALNQRLKSEMDARVGIPYHYGSTSGRSYDCSGLVWSVFQSAGINFERSSARTYWSEFEPVYGDDRYKFGTLVFFNHLGHIGIVVDDKGFYQASSSKGVTYTPFAGYWEKRIVGFRRVPMSYLAQLMK